MARTISIEEARKHLGEMVEAVRLRGDSYIITRKGKPSAALVPLEILERKERARKTLLEMIEAVHARNKDRSPEEIEALIEEALRSLRTPEKQPGEARAHLTGEGV